MPDKKYTLEQVRAASKPVDAWFTVLCVDPVAQRIVWLLANFTRVSPNAVSALSLVLLFSAAGLYWQGTGSSLSAGALIFLAAFVLDCVDGKLARLKGQVTRLGVWLDGLGGLVATPLCLIALMRSSYLETGDQLALFLGVIYFAYLATATLYVKLLRPKLTEPLFCKSTGLESEPVPLTTPRLRSLRLRLSPGAIEAQALMFVVFPLAGMTLQGLLAGVIAVLIDGLCYLIWTGLLLARWVKMARKRRQ